MWIQAAVLIVLAGLGYLLVAVYSRGFEAAIDAVQELGPDGTPAHDGPPGAPTRAEVNRLHDTLRQKLGVNARGLARVASMDYDGWPDRLSVVFALDHNPATMTAAQAAELRPMLDVLRGVHAGGLQWRWVMLSGTAPVDVNGKIAELSVVRAMFSREKLDKVDWSLATAESLRALAEQFSIALEPTEFPSGEVKAPQTRPADTRPVAQPAPGTAVSH
jgi:hypothetical protein